ncbi:MAG: metal-sensitive transcriptional regulator [Spirochaetales bacterium]
MDDTTRGKAIDRLKRIEGQVRGVVRMVEEDRYCMDILAQTRSIMAAMRKVEDQVMENHLNTCVREAMESGDEKERTEKISEIMTVLSGIRKNG